MGNSAAEVRAGLDAQVRRMFPGWHSRHYNVTTPAAHGGHEYTCAAEHNANQSQPCNTEACPYPPAPISATLACPGPPGALTRP
jgi:hypothetical protein